MGENKAFKNFVNLGMMVAINLGLQFLYQWYIITSLGANVQTDALVGAMALPQFILMVLGGSLTMVLIPIIARYSHNEFLKESWNYFQGVGLLFMGIALLLFLTVNWWIAWILPGFTGDNYLLAIQLTKIQLIAMLFSALLSVVWAIHSAKGDFLRIEYTSIAANAIVFILMMVFIRQEGIFVVAWLNVLRVLLQVVFLGGIMGPYRRPDFKTPSFKETWKKLRPLMLGNTYFKTDSLVDRYLTSRGVAGEVTLLHFAQQLYLAVNSVLIKILVNTMIPEMAKANAAGNEQRFNQIFRKRLLVASAYISASYLGMILIGHWILSFIFSFRNMTAAQVSHLWWLLILLGGYLLGDLLGSVTSGAFYAKGDTTTPTRIGTIIFTLYVPVKIYCYFKFGISGLAIAISTYQVTSFLTKLFFLRRHLRRYPV